MSRTLRTAATREAITTAVAGGFMDCRAIVRALYPEQVPGQAGAMGGSLPLARGCRREGDLHRRRTGSPMSPRPSARGVGPTEFPKVLAYKDGVLPANRTQ